MSLSTIQSDVLESELSTIKNIEKMRFTDRLARIIKVARQKGQLQAIQEYSDCSYLRKKDSSMKKSKTANQSLSLERPRGRNERSLLESSKNSLSNARQNVIYLMNKNQTIDASSS